MGTEVEKLAKKLEKLGYKISKKKQPKGTPDSHYFICGVFSKVAAKTIKQKDLTIRKIMMRTIEDKDFDVALDSFFKGPKRAAFDDKTAKKYNTAKTLVQDIYTNGQFKRYKLLERALVHPNGDPRSPTMQKNLNLKVKFRESFRPFAPSILREDVDKRFELNEDSPYMLLVADVKKENQNEMTDEEKRLFGIDKLNIKRSEIATVTHVDYSARIQTVHKETNKKYYDLIKKFKEITNCPVIVNTSFNVRGEPIVNSPEDAFNCFMGTELDNLAIGNCYLEKSKQTQLLKRNYHYKFELD